MTPLSPPFAVRPREDQFVADLANLFRRHRVRTGSPEYLELLAPVLHANNALRSDLLMLCNAISRMAESDLAPEELLQLVAKAVIGPAAQETEVPVPAELRDLFITSWQEYQARAESLSADPWDTPASGPESPQRSVGKFALAASRSAKQPAASASQQEPSEVTPETRIGELTISQLRTYLDDIEQRVGRLQPYLSSLQAGLPDQTAAPAVAEVAEANLPGIENSNSDHTSETLMIVSADSPDDSPAADETAPKSTPPQILSTPQELDPEEPLTKASADAITDQSEDAPPRLPLRTVLPLEDTALADRHRSGMFRSVSEPETAWSRRLLWTTAVLALLAPAAYFGEAYLYRAPATMPLTAPQPPGYPPPQALSPASAQVAPPAPAVLHATAHSTPRLLPKEVQMEAQAARAQER